MYGGYGAGFGGWLAMWGGMLLLWAAAVVVLVLLLRAVARLGEGGRPAGAAPAAERVLAQRFAAGDIDEEEYQRRLVTLRAAAPPGEG